MQAIHNATSLQVDLCDKRNHTHLLDGAEAEVP